MKPFLIVGLLLMALGLALFVASQIQAHHINPTPDRIGFMVGESKMLFDPKPDITTHELALCMDVMLTLLSGSRFSNVGAQIAAEKFRNLPPNVSRHFVPDLKT
jgi:hypothetical protein